MKRSCPVYFQMAKRIARGRPCGITAGVSELIASVGRANCEFWKNAKDEMHGLISSVVAGRQKKSVSLAKKSRLRFEGRAKTSRKTARHAIPYFTGGPWVPRGSFGLRDPSSRTSSFGVAGRPLGSCRRRRHSILACRTVAYCRWGGETPPFLGRRLCTSGVSFLGLELLLLVLAVLHQFLVLLQDLVARHAELWVDRWLIDWFED